MPIHDDSPAQGEHPIQISGGPPPATSTWKITQAQFRRLARTGEFAPVAPPPPAPDPPAQQAAQSRRPPAPPKAPEPPAPPR